MNYGGLHAARMAGSSILLSKSSPLHGILARHLAIVENWREEFRLAPAPPHSHHHQQLHPNSNQQPNHDVRRVAVAADLSRRICRHQYLENRVIAQ